MRQGDRATGRSAKDRGSAPSGRRAAQRTDASVGPVRRWPGGHAVVRHVCDRIGGKGCCECRVWTNAGLDECPVWRRPGMTRACPVVGRPRARLCRPAVSGERSRINFLCCVSASAESSQARERQGALINGRQGAPAIVGRQGALSLAAARSPEVERGVYLAGIATSFRRDKPGVSPTAEDVEQGIIEQGFTNQGLTKTACQICADTAPAVLLPRCAFRGDTVCPGNPLLSSRRRCGGPPRAAEAACRRRSRGDTRPLRLSALLRLFSAMCFTTFAHRTVCMAHATSMRREYVSRGDPATPGHATGRSAARFVGGGGTTGRAPHRSRSTRLAAA